MFSNINICNENIFIPSNAEFLDSFKYISDVRKNTHKTGIALIKTPKIWNPSFKFNIFSICYKFSSSKQWRVFQETNESCENVNWTIDEFVNYAEDFKRNYFDCPPDLVSNLEIEKAFFENRSAFSSKEDINYNKCKTIYYFSRSDLNAFKCHMLGELNNSLWNIAKIKENSVLKNVYYDNEYSKNNSCGMLNNIKMEMCFIFKKWKQANYNSYILDYLLWGDSKTWFCISPEFSDQVQKLPLDSIYDFAAYNIPINKIIQKVGDFVFLQPGVFYCTLSHGANFSQRAYYMPIEWLQFGLQNWDSIEQHRWNFCFDELLVDLVQNPTKLDRDESAMVYNIAKYLINKEISKRNQLFKIGFLLNKRNFKSKRCHLCRAMYFLSCIGCNKCFESANCYCLNDAVITTEVLSCCENQESSKCLNLQYTNEELIKILEDFKLFINSHMASYDNSEDNDISKKFDNRRINMDINSNKILQSLSHITHYYENLLDGLLHDNKIPNEEKLSVEQFELFIGRVENFSDKLRLHDKLQMLIKRIDEAKTEILISIKASSPFIEDIDNLILKYSNFPILLPEIHCLTLVKNLIIWNQQSSNLIGSYNDLSLYIESGKSILNHLKQILSDLLIKEDISIIKLTSNIIFEKQNMIEILNEWDKRGTTFFNEEFEISYIKNFIEEASELKYSFPCFLKLKEAFDGLNIWQQKYESIMNEEPSPYVYIAFKLLKEAESICVKSNKYSELKADLEAADDWVKEAFELFARPNSKITFYEIVAPKVMSSSLIIKRPNSFTNISSTLHQFFMGWNDPCYDPSPTLVADTFKQAESISVANIKQLRLLQTIKPNVCHVCRLNKSSIFVKCALCFNFCHNINDCSKPTHPKSKYKLCHYCIRSTRPQLEDVYPLVLSLQNIPLRIPEGEALQALAERSALWQSKVNDVLSLEICAPYVSLLSEDIWIKPVDSPENVPSLIQFTEANKEELDICMDTLNDFLIEGYLIEIFLDEINLIEQILDQYSHHTSLLPLKTLKQQSLVPIKEDNSQHTSIKNHFNSSNTYCPTKQNVILTHSTDELKSLPDVLGSKLAADQMLNSRTKFTTKYICNAKKSVGIIENKSINVDSVKKSVGIIENRLKDFDAVKKSVDVEIKQTVRNLLNKRLEIAKDFEIKLSTSKPQIIPFPNTILPSVSSPKSLPSANKRSKSLFPTIAKKCKFTNEENLITKMEKVGKNMTSKEKKNKSDDNFENCAADKCLHPIGEEVNWVMCDKCSKWFHLHCLSLTKSQISEDCDFYCFKCKKN